MAKESTPARYELVFGDDEEVKLSGTAEHLVQELEGLLSFVKTAPIYPQENLLEGMEWKLLEKDEDDSYRDIAEAGVRCTVRVVDSGCSGS